MVIGQHRCRLASTTRAVSTVQRLLIRTIGAIPDLPDVDIGAPQLPPVTVVDARHHAPIDTILLSSAAGNKVAAMERVVDAFPPASIGYQHAFGYALRAGPQAGGRL